MKAEVAVWRLGNGLSKEVPSIVEEVERTHNRVVLADRIWRSLWERTTYDEVPNGKKKGDNSEDEELKS